MNANELIEAKSELYDAVLKEVSNSTPNLKELDHWRNIEFPNELLKRFKLNDLKIDKSELTKLMDWKLKKGKFRPTLKKLISQNEEEDIISITQTVFRLITNEKNSNPSKDEYKKLIKSGMTQLVKLRGVGPATASLLLSILNKITKLAPPFYSDEAAEFLFEKFSDSSNVGGEIKLKYSMAEYMKWLDLFYDLNDDFSYDFTDLENGMWVLKKNEYYELKPREKGEEATNDEKNEVDEKRDFGKKHEDEDKEKEDDDTKPMKKRKTEK